MTATAPLRAPSRRPAGRPERPTLRLVRSGPLVASRTAFGVVVGAVLVGGLIALLMLHTLAAQDAFRLQQLQRQAATLHDAVQQASLAEQQREDPTTLATRARALGMVPTTSLAFVRMHGHHGRIVGVAAAAAAPVAPPPAPSTAPATAKHASAKPAATQQATTKPAGRKQAGSKHATPARRATTARRQ